LVVYDPEFSTGVIGLIAGRLLEEYKRPVIVLAPEGGEIKGSVRSLGTISAVTMLQAVSETLERFGGHTKAAGLTLKLSPSDFAEAVWKWAKRENISLEELRESAERVPELIINLSQITDELL